MAEGVLTQGVRGMLEAGLGDAERRACAGGSGMREPRPVVAGAALGGQPRT